MPNRRDHRGSSPFTETELEELKHGKQSFLDDIGKSLYDFLSHLIETERIPKISSDRQSGGIVILGWSAGVISSLTLLQNPDLLDSKDYTVLQEYIRDLIFEGSWFIKCLISFHVNSWQSLLTFVSVSRMRKLTREEDIIPSETQIIQPWTKYLRILRSMLALTTIIQPWKGIK